MQVRWLIPFLLLIVILVAACAPNAAGETPIPPTFTLIPVTPSETPTDVPPTSTPANLPAPQDVLSGTDTPTPTAPTAASGDDTLISDDPVATELVRIAQRFVADDLDLPTSRVRLVSVVPVAWTDSALNCPLPTSSDVIQQETDGYRIVVQAGDQEFLFHTDFDRVVPCDIDDEQLPEGFILPTEEATREATAESTAEATEAS